MKNKKYKKVMAAILLVTMMTGCAAAPSGKETPKDKTEQSEVIENMTLGELADYFIEAADDYNPKIDRKAVLEGFEEGEQATRLQMFVLASRAFGELPAPTGNAKRLAPPAVDLSEVPEWAKKDLKNLSDGGILAASDFGLVSEGKESGQEESTAENESEAGQEESPAGSESEAGQEESPAGSESEDGQEENPAGSNSESQTGQEKTMEAQATSEEAQLVAARFFRIFAANNKDDFFASVNKSILDALEIKEGEGTAGGSSEVTANTDEQLRKLIEEIVSSREEYPKGSPEQKIRDLYQNFENVEARNKEGIKPLQKYLDAVDAAGSFKEFNAAVAQAVNELGNYANGIFPGIAMTDTKDSSRKVLGLLTQTPGLALEDYENPAGEAYKAYYDTIVGQLTGAGESQEDAKRHADAIMKLEQDLAANMSSQEEMSTIQTQNYYTPGKMDELMPQAKMSELFLAIGLKDDVEMTVFDDKQFEAYTKWFTEENLELFKSLQKISLFSGYASCLSTELAEKGGNESIPTGDIAVQNYLSEELGKIYAQRYFPEESKEEVEKMVNMMIETFKDRIKRLDWMEEATKKEALKKLDSMNILIGYPDEWRFNDAEIKSVAEGGSYFQNVAASELDKWKKQLEDLENPTDPRRFSLSAYTVNAAASRSSNTIIFPAGILQAPFYDKDASFEENLASIGSTIAHEITHMFDDGGAQYDSQGNVKNWWAEADYTHFQDLCKKAEAFYEGQEAAAGIPADGAGTLSENIADIGGIACGLEILSKMENPDYDAFFRSYAKQWARTADYETLAEMAGSDVHAPNNLRCNRVLANFQEFYDTYKITSGDGMYVAPEDRIKIW